MSSRRRRLIRTFVPIALAASVPLTIIWILGPMIRNAAEMQIEVQKTNPLMEAPPPGYADPGPVLAGIETTLRTLHSYDFPNQRDTSANEGEWGSTVRNNLEWADLKRFQIVRIDLGDATASVTTEPEDWTWLFPPLKAERVGKLYCKVSPFVGAEPVAQVLDTAPWQGLVTGAFARTELDAIADACAQRNVELFSGFNAYYRGANEFIAGFTWNENDSMHLDVRGVGDTPPGAARNLIFLLTMQHRPNAVFTHLSSEEHPYAWIMNANAQDSRNWYAYLRARVGERPVANVVFDAPDLEVGSALAHYRRHFLATTLSAIGMAGYDAVITNSDTSTDADLYVVLSETGRLSAKIQPLVDANHPILWLPVTGIGVEGTTTAAAEAFGIKDGVSVGEPGPAPDIVKIDSAPVIWQTQSGQDSNPSYVALEQGAINGEVLFAHEGAALVIREANRAVLNGAALHPEAGHALAQTIAQVAGSEAALTAPFEGYGVSGTRSAYFATGATELRVNLRHDDGTPFQNGDKIRIVRFNGYGNPRGVETLNYEAPFTEIMTANQLVIVEAAPDRP